MRTKIATLALAGAFATATLAGADCRYEEPRGVTAPTAGVSSIRIEAVAGSLDVVGGSGSRIEASGHACVSDSAYFAGTTLTSRREGSVLVIEARTAEPRGRWFGNDYATLPFRVDVPADLPVEIDDGSGPITAERLSTVSIHDGSGSIDVLDIAGDLTVHDGSGSMRLERIGGAVRIRDGSGSIEVRNVRRDVVVESDGSGSIDIRDVIGNVVIEEDGSGSIAVRNIGGDFTVVDDGSGGISVKDVKGRVSIPRD